MNVYLIRHGKAVAQGDPSADRDEDRPLADEGEAQAAQLAHALQRHGVQLDAVLTSPAARAHRTAAILLQEWSGPAPQLTVVDRLAPQACKPKRLGRLLREQQKENVAVVAHQPDLSAWAAWLLGSKKVYVDFAKGGAAYFLWESELRKGGGALVWLVDPTWCAATGTTTDNPALVMKDEG